MLDVIVDGRSCPVPPQPLISVRQGVLTAMANTGRPASDWGFLRDDGTSVVLSDTIEDGTRLWLTLTAAGGASHTNHRRPKDKPGRRPQCGARSTKVERIRTWTKDKVTMRRLQRRRAKRLLGEDLPFPRRGKGIWTFTGFGRYGSGRGFRPL